MSLSVEALAQLEELDLQEARGGLAFVSTAGSREPLVADLSSEELAGLRSWDLSGVLARLNSLTFEPPPAPMPETETGAVLPPDGGVRAPTGEDELPDWLKPAEETAPEVVAEPPAEEIVEPAPFPEEQPAAPSGPTAEVIEIEEVAAVEAGVKKGLAKWLEKIDFGKLANEGARYLIPPLTGLTLGRFLSPEQALNLTQTAFAVGMLGFIGSGGCAVAEKVVSGHPRVAGIARLLAAGRVTGAVFAETGMLMAAGSFAGGLLHEREIIRQAAAQMGQPEVVGGGGGNIGGDYYHGVSDVDLLQPQVVEPPRLSTDETNFLNQVGHTELTEAQERLAAEQAAEAAQRAAEAARQAALEAATRVVEVQPNDNLTTLVARAGGDPYGADFTNTVLQSADVLTGPQNPNRDMARALIEFIKAHPGGVNWRDAINGVGSLAKEVVGGVPLKDAIAQATRMVYPGQEMKIVVGAGIP